MNNEMREWMKEVTEMIKAIRTGQEFLAARVDSIDIRLTRMEERLSGVEGELKNVREMQEEQSRVLELLASCTENPAHLQA